MGVRHFVLAIVRKITKRKQAEEEIRRLNGALRELKNLVGKLVGAQEEEQRRVAYEVHEGWPKVRSPLTCGLSLSTSRARGVAVAT